MNLTFVGVGYVGLVTAVGFAEKGNAVCCVDINPKRVEMINQGLSPIYEKDLSSSIQTALQNKRLLATTSFKEGMDFADIIFIAVGTPSTPDGSANMTYVYEVLESILSHLTRDIIIINKSTVPVGTANLMKQRVKDFLKEQNLSFHIEIISNPEFLREGEALHDFLYPDRIVIGGSNREIADHIGALYRPFVNDTSQILFMDNLSAEMTKYAANAMLATRISFMNEISRLCDKTGADIENVRKGIASDTRIGPYFLKAGVGFGGSCFPKDIDALIYLSQTLQETAPLLRAVKEVNKTQRSYFMDKIKERLGSLKGLSLAIWGLSFKAGTDDVRDSPAIDIILELSKNGVRSFSAYDFEASENAKVSLTGINVHYLKDKYEALVGQEALIILTDSSEFLNPDFLKIKSLLNPCLIFDGKNIFDPVKMKNEGIEYFSIGRG